MEKYIRRLEKIGIPAHRAYQLVYDFLKEFGNEELEEFVTDMERDAYVGRI